MALRELNIPQHISILYVQQEVTGDDTAAIDSVLSADVHRTRLLAEEAELNTQLQALEDTSTGANAETSEQKDRRAEELSTRLGDVQNLLVEIDAYTGPSRAAELLAGLGFSADDQVSRCRASSCVSGQLNEHQTLLFAETSDKVVLWWLEDALVACSR